MIPEFFDKNCMIYQYDGVLFLDALLPESVQLVWTSPPFYGDDDPDPVKNVSQMESIELCAAVADSAFRALSPGSVLVLNLGHQAVDDVASAVAKRTHLQPEGFIWDTLALEDTAVVFRKGPPAYRIFHSDGYWPDGRLELLSAFINKNTNPGDIVVDPFCGYGDVMEAAVNSGRVAVMNDHSPTAVEATINRYKERCV